MLLKDVYGYASTGMTASQCAMAQLCVGRRLDALTGREDISLLQGVAEHSASMGVLLTPHQ